MKLPAESLLSDASGERLLTEALHRYSPSGNETEVAEFLVNTMLDLGFKARVDEVGNAVGEIGEGRQSILLLGHMDTVQGDLPVLRRGDELYGRGSVDAKGPLVAFIMAAARQGNNCGLHVRVVGAVEEEAATSKGAYHIVQAPPSDYVIIGEPSGWSRITLGYKGRLLIDYSVTTSVGHTARADCSATEMAVEFWLSLKSLVEEYNEGTSRVFDLLQPSLRNINSESDGIEDRTHMTVGLRLPVGLDLDELQGRIRKICKSGNVTFRGREQAFKASKNTPLTRAFLTAIRSEGERPAFVLKTGTSDMNVIGPRWSCPIVAYGPGDAALDHTPEEHISISEYLQGIRVLEKVLQELGESNVS